MHRVTDVSEDGLWIQTDLLLEVGSTVALTFFPPDWEEPLYVAGRVQRVEIQPRRGDGNAVGMGIAFEALRRDERRRLTRSMRGLRAEGAFILDQHTLTGVPVGVVEPYEPALEPGRTVVGWAAPSLPAEYEGRPSRITARPAEAEPEEEHAERAFPGGLDLAASVFSD